MTPIALFCTYLLGFIIYAITAFLENLYHFLNAIVTRDLNKLKLVGDNTLKTAATFLLFTFDAVDNLLAGVVAPITRICSTIASATIQSTPTHLAACVS